MLERFLGVRKRQQIVIVTSTDTAPAQMLRYKHRIDPARERFQPRQMAQVERVGGTERQSHAVEGDRIVGSDPLQCPQSRPTIGEVVFAVDLEPCNGGTLREHLRDVWRTKADARGHRHTFAHDGQACTPILMALHAGGCDIAYFAGAVLPPIDSQVPFATYFHSVGSFATLAPRPAQACFAV